MSETAPSSQRDWLAAIDRVRDRSMAAAAVVTFAVSWAILAFSGLAPQVVTYLFVVPIVLLALRYGLIAGSAGGAIAALLAGPLAGAAAPDDPGVALGQGVALVGIGAFVGALTRAREERQRHLADLAERERALVAQRAALVQVVSHEFRTPLTVLAGSVETLSQRELAVGPSGRQLVRAMERSVERLQDMLDVMLAAAEDLEVEAAALSQVEVAELVRHAAASLRPQLPERLRVEVPKDAAVRTVESHLWLLLRCLLDNADRFSPEDAAVTVTFHRDDGMVVIGIDDRGPGLAEEDRERVFQAFWQGDGSERRTHGGLGLGLYTARRLARRLGGDVLLEEGHDRRGARAEVRLPAQGPALPEDRGALVS